MFIPFWCYSEFESKSGLPKSRGAKQCSLTEGDGLVSTKGDSNLAKQRRRGNLNTLTLEGIPKGIRSI